MTYVPHLHMLSILSEAIIIFDLNDDSLLYRNPACLSMQDLDASQVLPSKAQDIFLELDICKEMAKYNCEENVLFHHVIVQGHLNNLECTITAWKDANQTHLYCLLTKIPECEELTNIDALTGCLQKCAFETLASRALDTCTNDNHAIIIVDLDNFKAVNDNLGHQFGDMVLTEVGAKLRSFFRMNDYVGRIGGDEFMIFMRNVSSLDILIKKAETILKELDRIYQGSLHQYRITASIGIATYPQDGNTFTDLYNYADIALYDAKNRGKNGYVFYDKTLSKGTMENTMPYDVAARALSQHFDGKIVSQAFNLLFETKDFDISMNSVLQLLGIRFGISRAYIFECSPNCTDCYDNTYEWCAEDILPAIEICQNIPKETFQILMEQGNSDGIIYCNDVNMLDAEVKRILDLQDIKSFLHAYIYSGDEVLYAIGFDDCSKQRIWSPIEISTLLHVSKIIAQFLNYKNVLHTTETIATERLSVIDSLNCFSYIVDCETHEITYFNKYTQKKVPSIQIGDICYKVLRGLEEECKDCPLRTMEELNTDAVRSVLSDTTMGKYMLINASKLSSFHGKKSMFVSANNVTDIVNLV